MHSHLLILIDPPTTVAVVEQLVLPHLDLSSQFARASSDFEDVSVTWAFGHA
jgi:hypothetical protein